MTVPDAMRAEILRFYGAVEPSKAGDKKERKNLERKDGFFVRVVSFVVIS